MVCANHAGERLITWQVVQTENTLAPEADLGAQNARSPPSLWTRPEPPLTLPRLFISSETPAARPSCSNGLRQVPLVTLAISRKRSRQAATGPLSDRLGPEPASQTVLLHQTESPTACTRYRLAKPELPRLLSDAQAALRILARLTLT